MNLYARISADIKEAMKSKNELELSTLRLVRAALKNKEIELMHPLTDDEILAVIKTMVRQGKDALVDFESAKRQDLIDRQTQELKILESYLPAQMPQEELEVLCKQAIKQSGVNNSADINKVMGFAMKLVAGRADGGTVRATLLQLLS